MKYRHSSSSITPVCLSEITYHISSIFFTLFCIDSYGWGRLYIEWDVLNLVLYWVPWLGVVCTLSEMFLTLFCIESRGWGSSIYWARCFLPCFVLSPMVEGRLYIEWDVSYLVLYWVPWSGVVYILIEMFLCYTVDMVRIFHN